MKKHITTALLMIILFANTSGSQNNDYTKLWKEVKSLEQDGLPKSALEKVEVIALMAKTQNNASQQIKALLFISKFTLTLEEDAQLKIISSLKAEINSSVTPTKNVLENILAHLYWQYFQQNRYKFYNRTETSEKVNTEDFRTWDLQTLFNEVQLHFSNSLNNGLILQQTKLEQYDLLLSQQKDSKLYRPTLFDFLSHNALSFYSTNESQINKPAYKFEIDDSNFIGDAGSFSTLNISSKDSSSQALNALKIYQDLIQFHLKDASHLALVDVNIKRLQYVKQQAVFNDKESLLIKTLKIEADKIKKQDASALYLFELASIYRAQGLGYSPDNNSENRWEIKEAISLCDEVISNYPNSKGAEKCIILKHQILAPNLQITTEGFLPINQHARLLIDYRNIDNVSFKAYKITEKEHEAFKDIYRQEEQEQFIAKLKEHTLWNASLKNENDYQSHTTELVFPKLDNGRYIITANSNNAKGEIASHTNLQVTNIVAVETEGNKYKQFQFIDRNNGAPITNTDVKLTYITANKKQRIEQITTDAFGLIKISKNKKNSSNLKLSISYKNDTAHFGDYSIYRAHNYNNKKTTHNNAFIFTDRSIYRPGQTIHFKTIAISTTNEKSTVLANEKLTVALYNVNGEKVKALELVTNDYGSVSETFILPNNGLTGSFSIKVTATGINANAPFSVEEYKRPKFETHFNPVTETVKVNDSVTVKGEALAFAGSTITDAKVVYRVKRNVQYPSWYYWSRLGSDFSEAQEITHGETTTDDKGNYEITFKAIPDASVDKNNLPVFTYEITADVTDINGETKSASTFVKVGYHALVASIAVHNVIDKTDKKQELSIHTSNLNGAFIPAKGTIKIYKLLAPEYVLRQRPWNSPDYQTLSKQEFKTLFPHDAYANEDQSRNWKKGTLVLDKNFNTEKSKTLALGNMKRWESGQYIIELESKDKYGQIVKDQTKTVLYSDKDKQLADKQLFSITTDKTQYHPNDIVNITLATAAKDITVTLSVEKDKKIIKTHVITLNNNKKTISIPVTQNDLGGFAISYSFAAFNSFKSGQKTINVPRPRTDLQIETLTFRNKIQPGTDETWSFKIKGAKGDKVAAELLASMYDASLDAFKSHYWHFSPIYHPNYSSSFHKNAYASFDTNHFSVRRSTYSSKYASQQQYDQQDWFGFYFGREHIIRRRNLMKSKKMTASNVLMETPMAAPMLNESVEADLSFTKEANFIGNSNNSDTLNYKFATEKSGNFITSETTTKKETNFEDVVIRKNLQETAFFFPQLQTDKAGNISFSFTTPEALTKWKLQLLAHTKPLETTTLSLHTVTQKELMVMPNTPRFLREGDRIKISTKIANLSDKQLSGQSVLQLFDALSGKPIDSIFSNLANQKDFTVNAKGNTQVTWDIAIPNTIQAVQYKIIAKAGNYSDGEQNALPVLTNRMLVTETLPMWVKSNETKTFTLDKLKQSAAGSTTLKNHKLTLEITSNPAWYAVQALPYLMEFPYQCNEQTFSRYYANALASHIANSNPRIQAVFNQWKNTDAVLSNLEKNQELKSILIEETPWLRDAQSETEQKKRIALLFDLNKMNSELTLAKRKLEKNQMPSGAWSWFAKNKENRFITQHIITGFGHLKQLNVIPSNKEDTMIQKAIGYLDAEFVKEYKNIRKYNKDADLKLDRLSYTQLHYLYMRSFFSDIKTTKEVDTIIAYYHSQIKTFWLKRSLYAKGMMALIMQRSDNKTTASKILKSLKENSITSEELGMYWKSNTNSWYWHQAPIETQALLIEAFAEIENDTETIDNLKIWLLKNKQTSQWKTTKATTEAVYALLLQGSDWLSVTDMVDVVIGGKQISPETLENVKIEAGTGYYKTAWNTTEIKPEMAEVKLAKKGKGIAWGGLYWQYFEDLDKITTAETSLKLKKKLFKMTNTDTGEVITEITKDSKLKVGDLVRVRIELTNDRPMEFVHMKDMRAAGLEPINVLSKYKYQDGLGYYESTKDASTNFFFDYLPKGVFVFEYDLRVNNAGNMSNGITTIQSMYAPEFSSHSEGIRVTVE